MSWHGQGILMEGMETKEFLEFKQLEKREK